MTKRTFAIVAVFAALLSVTLSVQAENYDYYWKGGSGDYFTQSKWQLSDGTAAPVPLDSTSNVISAFVQADGSTVNFNYSILGAGVKSLTIGGDTGTVSVTRNSNSKLTIDSDKFISVLDKGTLTVQNTTIIDAGGTLTVNGGTYNQTGMTISGTFDYTSSKNFVNNNTITLNDGGTFNLAGGGQFRINGATAALNIQGGTATVDDISYIGVTANGVINQSGGNATFNKSLVFGWGDGDGTYNLSAGTLTTTDNAGLWCSKTKGFNTFNMTGGTANFNKAGNSFAVGLYDDGTVTQWTPRSVANVFNLYSGTVNAADTFAIQYGGTLNVAKNGATGGDGVLNAKAITLTNTGYLNMSSGTINVGEGGITSSDGAYSITLSGGTFGTKGSNWSSDLTASISSDAVTFSPDEGKTITWSGVLSGAGGVTKTGDGTLKLTGANTYTGKTTVSGGKLIVSGKTAKLASTVIDVASDTTLTYYNTVPQNTAPLTFNVNGGTLEFYNDRTNNETHNDTNAICPGTATNGITTDVTINVTGGTLLIDGGGYVAALNGSSSTITFNLDKNSTIHVQNGHFLNGGHQKQNWDSNKAELKIGSTGIVDLWDGAQMKVGGLTGDAGAQLYTSKKTENCKGMIIGNGVEANQSYTYNGTISLNGTSLDYNGAGTQTLNGDITKTNIYSKNGTLILGKAGNDMKINTGVLIKEDGGAVQVDGNLIVESGIFYPIGDWSTGNGTVTVKSGAQMRVGGTFGSTIGITLDGGKLFNDGENGHGGLTATVSSPITVTADSQVQCGWDNGALTLSGGLNGSGNLTFKKDASHPSNWINLSGTGDYQGSITLEGYLRIGAENANIGTETDPASAADYIGSKEIQFNGGTLHNYDAHLAFSNDLNFTADSSFMAGWDKNMTFTGNIMGSGKLTVFSDSGWVIMGTSSTSENPYTGDITIDWASASKMGQVRLAADQPFGANAGQGNIYGKLDMNGFSQTFKGLNSDGDKGKIYNDSTTFSTLTLDTTGKDLTFQSSITGNINLVIKGTGKQTLSQKAEYKGSTTIESGTLVLSNGGTLYNLSGAGNLNFGANSLELVNTANTVYSGALSGSGKVTFQNGSGWIEMAQPGAFTGDVQLNYANSDSQGRVRLGADNALGTANRAYIYGSIDMNGYDQSFAGLSNNGNKGSIFNDTDTLSTLTIDTTSLTASSQFHSSIKGNIALVLTGTGIMTLTKAPEYTGSTTIEAGTLALSEGGTLYNLSGGSDASGEMDVAANLDATGKALTLNNSETTKFVGSIKAASIEKTGDGTLQIYSSADKQVDAGHFLVSSGRLDMKTYFKGAMEIGTGTTMSPGNSVGILTIDGQDLVSPVNALTLNSGSTLLMEIGGSDVSQNDQLIVIGDLVINEGAIIELALAEGASLGPNAQIAVKLTSSNGATLRDDVLGALTSIYFKNLDFDYNDAGGYYQITGFVDPNAVPEPSTWALLILGAAGLMYWRKRKNS